MSPRRRLLRRLLFLVMGALYIASVPWYREPGAAPEIWLGLPSWVAVAIICYAAVAVLNAVAWQLTEISDEPVQDASSAAGENQPEQSAR